MTSHGFAHQFVAATIDRLPALLLLHGTGGNEHDMIPLGQQLLPGAALVSPRGKVLENGMPRFFRRLREGVFDQEDLARQTDDLAAFLDGIRHAHQLPDPPIAVGYSNGANIVASLLLRYPQALNGAVLFRPVVPFVPAVSPDLRGVPILLSAGRQDRISSPGEIASLKAMFDMAGAAVTLHWHEGGHELGPDDIDAARRWLLTDSWPAE